MGQGHPTGCRTAEDLAAVLAQDAVVLNASDEKELATLQARTDGDARARV
jgi:hypothetical protein